MSKNKLLFCTGEGIGNVIQTIPVIRTLTEVLGYEVDFWHAFGSFGTSKLIPYVGKWIRAEEILDINPSDYVGKVSTFWTVNYMHNAKVVEIKLLNNPTNTKLSMTTSEVSSYMTIAKELGAEKFIWDGVCMYDQRDEYFDVVIHNGYNWKGSSDWRMKSYPHYNKVIALLKEHNLKICSVGSKNEYIKGTVNKTGLPLLDTFGVMNNCRVFLGNDSGLYHCANALQVPNVVIFTFTSTEKNYDVRFHKYAKIVGRDDLKCRWCQCAPRFRACETKECRNIDPKVIVDALMEKLDV
jgi:ADP-heptose:LPS heptosyltransferase